MKQSQREQIDLKSEREEEGNEARANIEQLAERERWKKRDRKKGK